jgi:predicted nucleic acid-binding protein
VNASPLIFLTHVGLLDVLNEPGIPVLVPDVVVKEIGAYGATDPAVIALLGSGWIQIVPTPSIPALVAACRLDAGETAVLAVALEESDAQVVLDDLAARHCAKGFGLQLQGTLGFLLVAKAIGMIPEVRPLIDSAKKAGLYVSDRLARIVLDQAGE